MTRAATEGQDDKYKVIIATDCGSTTTKAILIEYKNGEYRQTFRGEAPTTVEAPFEDVTKGVLNSIQEIEELSGRKILDGDKVITPANGEVGVDAYISTSSAGGGLQMMVAGAIKTMTAESAQRAALGAGAIVMDVLASNDKRLPHQKIERIRQLRPDMILLSGGTDGGTVTHVVELAEYIAAADPKPRLGIGYRLPILYAGNNKAQEQVKEILGEKMELVITENLRPTLERENLMPARLEIQNLFLEHVMAQAPGYKKLIAMTSTDIMPTPGAVGQIMQTIAKMNNINVIGVDIGGATTDVFSVIGEIFNRTVSANYGMSYSISNVLADATLENVMRWLSFDIDEKDVRDRIKNKMIRPTTIPQTLDELKIEQAIAREALRLSFDQHKLLAVGLKGVQQTRSLSDVFTQEESGQSIIKMLELDMIVGSGGVLSHAPRRSQSMSMMIDSFQPEGITSITVDSIFMMPHLGVLSKINPRAATEVFEKDCLIYLGTCIAPVGMAKDGTKIMDYKIKMGDKVISESINFGELKFYHLGPDESAEVELSPLKNFDVGKGAGKTHRGTIKGGVVGLVIDGRGRPLIVPSDQKLRKQRITEWNKAMDLYPKY
ncbi:MAG: glutamate mutase L [Oligoflexia bacterium]|nr:glutamate mutase L [Oligoflexia bacterium]MBF0365725.1 glutamate mutase L [Oligoflexia bacterium]